MKTISTMTKMKKRMSRTSTAQTRSRLGWGSLALRREIRERRVADRAVLVAVRVDVVGVADGGLVRAAARVGTRAADVLRRRSLVAGW